jgi:PIN domain nuclease of toxin-antitoxin system
LDTHAWLWMLVAPERFSAEALALIRGLDNELLFSAASAWEIAIKYALGRLPLPQSPAEYVPSRLAISGVGMFPVNHGHALHVASLPPHHRDPFDRMLIAQAQVEGMVIVTADREFARYDVDVRWAA